jgi:hypothetical protein
MESPVSTSKRCHKSKIVATPTNVITNKPTILHPRVRAKLTPVKQSQIHHFEEKALKKKKNRLASENTHRYKQ